MKRLLFFICTLLCANVLLAQDFSEGDFAYEITGAGEVKVWCNNEGATSVNIPSSVTKTWTHGEWKWSSVYEDYIYITITDSVITYSVTSIGDWAFFTCFSLTSVTIPNSVTSIGEGAFYYCDSLTSVTIPNSVTSIGDRAFDCCSSLTSITIPNSVTSIGYYMFGCCSSLTSVTIPNSVTSIGDYAFSSCSSLTSVNIGNSVTSIGEEAFRYCSSLTSVNIGNSVTSIGEQAFEDCGSLTSVTIPNSVTSIGIGAFRYCSSLTSVTIPNSVDTIGNYAFCHCPLTSITFLANNTYNFNFSNIFCITSTGSQITLYVPNGCRDDYENWENYVDCIVELGSDNSIPELNVEVNNEEWGSVEVDEECGTATLTAVVEEDCSEFLHWSDGDTNNPRVVNVVNNPSFTAIFKDPIKDTIIDVIIMQGETYNFNGQELSEEGVYNATVLSVAGCEINLTINLYVISNDYTNGETSSLQETEVEEIVFYPNPTKGLISFSKSIEKIEVVDISGKILLSFSNVREINIGDLPAGSYLLRLHSNENSVLRKIVKE